MGYHLELYNIGDEDYAKRFAAKKAIMDLKDEHNIKCCSEFGDDDLCSCCDTDKDIVFDLYFPSSAYKKNLVFEILDSDKYNANYSGNGETAYFNGFDFVKIKERYLKNKDQFNPDSEIDADMVSFFEKLLEFDDMDGDNYCEYFAIRFG